MYQKYNLVKFFWVNRSFFCVKERMSDSLKKTSNPLICSFIMSDLSESLTTALLTWATWAIRSQSLFYPEQSEQIAHSRSFDLSGLSKWANEQMSEWAMNEWAMSEWANPNPDSNPWHLPQKSGALTMSHHISILLILVNIDRCDEIKAIFKKVAVYFIQSVLMEHLFAFSIFDQKRTT